MKKYLIFFALAVIALQGCHANISTIQKMEHIDPAIKSEIATLNTKIFNALTNKQESVFLALLSDSLRSLKSQEKDTTFFPQLCALSKLPKRVFEEYLASSSTTGTAFSLKDGMGDYAYTFTIFPVTKSTYVSMFILGDSGTQFMLTLTYGKVNNMWKLNVVRAGQYALCFKSAPDYYNEALNYYNKGNLLDAANTIELCKKCETPGQISLTYDLQKKMDEAAKKILGETNRKYPMPYDLPRVAGTPKLYNILYGLIDKTLVPWVVYQTNVDFTDSAALKQQYEGVRKYVRNTFPDFYKNHEVITFKCYNNMPQKGKLEPRSHEFTDKK